MMHDVETDPEAEDTYECLRCGELVEAESHPVACPECGGAMQNRANSLE